MKIQSEFYLEELFHIMRGINMQIDEAGLRLNRANRRHTILSFLTPWRKRELDVQLIEVAMNCVKLTNVLKEVSDKIMESEGRDEDGSLISLEEMMHLMEED